MASLLLWLDWHGRLDDAVWQRLMSRATARCTGDIFTRSGPGWRAWARKSRSREATPLLESQHADRGRQIWLFDRATRPADVAPPGTNVDRMPELWQGGVPCASIRLDCERLSVELARDPMGHRDLVYATVPGGLVVASGEDVLAAHPDVDTDPDREWLAAFFVWLPWADAATPYRGIRRVCPGETLQFRASGHSSRREPVEPDDDWRGKPDRMIVERFGELLHNAVTNACDGADRIGLSMSAGLDSCAIAACIHAAPRCAPAPLVSVTQGLDGFPTIDERPAARALAQAFGHVHEDFAADDLLPYCLTEPRPICPDNPLQTPFREWKERSYRVFRAHGVDVVLTGNFGDHLFHVASDWAVDGLTHRRWRALCARIRHIVGTAGWRGLARDGGLRRLAIQLAGRGDPLPARLNWLRAPFRDALRDRLSEERRRYRAFARPRQAELLLGADAAADACGEDWYAHRHGIEFRSPYRDLALTRFCLSIPADFSVRGTHGKWLLRQAMDGLLPDAVRLRPKGADLTPWEIHADNTQSSVYRCLAEGARDIACTLFRPDLDTQIDADAHANRTWFEVSFATWMAARAGTGWTGVLDEARHQDW